MLLPPLPPPRWVPLMCQQFEYGPMNWIFIYLFKGKAVDSKFEGKNVVCFRLTVCKLTGK